MKEDMEAKSRELDNIIGAAREASVRIGIGAFSEEFNNEAEDLEKRSRWWLLAAALGVAVTIAAAIGWELLWPMPTGGKYWVLHAFSKVPVIVMLFTVALTCAQMFRSLQHQRATNRHRALTLQTFRSFVEGTEDPDVRDAVLTIAASSVFANSPTGLAGSRGAPTDPASGPAFLRVLARTLRREEPS